MAWPLIIKVMLGLGAGALMFGVGAKEAGARPGGGKMPAWLETQYLNAKKNGAKLSPAELNIVADLLRTNGFKTEADEIADLAKTRMIAESPTATPAEKIAASAVTAIAKTQAEQIIATAPPKVTSSAAVQSSALTARQALAKRVSDHLNALVKAQGSVTRAKGKEDTALIRTFQQQEGLKNDGMYGPKSALQLGRVWGNVPLVFYWPKYSQPNVEVPKYRSNLETLALEAEQKNTGFDVARAKALRYSAFREKGQGYGSSTNVSSPGGITTAEALKMQQDVAALFFS